MIAKDFEEIGHSGGQVSLNIKTDAQGKRLISFGIRLSNPVPSVVIGIYALPQGIPVSTLSFGGIGSPDSPPPIAGCYPVYIGSDSHGKFGHMCPNCHGYWRSGTYANVCPYCATHAPSHEFLSEAQLRYVKHYCDVFGKAINSDNDGVTTIDLDKIAKDARSGQPTPFQLADKSQQKKFTCKACGEFNDILGRFGHCSLCGTRNDLAVFEDETLPDIRTRLNANDTPEGCVRDAVSAFDSYLGQLTKQLVELVPMTASRKKKLSRMRFQDLDEIKEIFNNWFGIDPFAGMDQSEIAATKQMFLRRHVYEHNGGEVDQMYLDKSGDNSVRLKQHIHETKADAHSLLNGLARMAKNIHKGFHDIIPPIPEPITAHAAEERRKADYEKRHGG